MNNIKVYIDPEQDIIKTKTIEVTITKSIDTKDKRYIELKRRYLLKKAFSKINIKEV